MSAFRKKPLVIEAMQFISKDARPIPPGVCLGDGECMHGKRFTGFGTAPYPDGPWGQPHVVTLEGSLTVSPGDWIIRGVKGEFYPCKPDIFAATYEPAAPEKAPALDLVGELVEALEAFGSNYPDGLPCFCEMRGNNPMVSRHSPQCHKARAALARAKEQGR